MTGLEALVQRWRTEADTVVSRYGDEATGRLLRTLAAELDEALREEADELLTLAQAAEVSGYSPDHVRHLVSDGTLANAGQKGAPRIRRGDVPTKPGRTPSADHEDTSQADRILRATRD